MTLAEALKRYAQTVTALSRGNTRHELSIFKRIGEGLGPDTVLDDLSPAVVHAWRDGLLKDGSFRGFQKKSDTKRKGLKPASINRYVDTLRAVLRKAHLEWGCLLRMPVIKTLRTNNGKLRFLTDDEERALLAAAAPHLRDYLVFLLGTGARKNEGLLLTWDDVDLTDNRAAAVTFLTTKNGEPRRVPVPDSVRDLLLRLRGARKDRKQNRVFVRSVAGTGDEQIIQPFDSVHGSFATALKNSKVTGVTLHTMRHTYASRLVMEGQPLYNVSKLLGHKNIKQTQRYAHLAPDAIDRTVDALNRRAERIAASL